MWCKNCTRPAAIEGSLKYHTDVPQWYFKNAKSWGAVQYGILNSTYCTPMQNKFLVADPVDIEKEDSSKLYDTFMQAVNRKARQKINLSQEVIDTFLIKKFNLWCMSEDKKDYLIEGILDVDLEIAEFTITIDRNPIFSILEVPKDFPTKEEVFKMFEALEFEELIEKSCL